MEKIDSLGGAFPYNPQKKKDRIKKKDGTLPFSALLGETPDTVESELGQNLTDRGHETLEELLDEVFELGEALKDSPTLAALGKYKRSVKGLFDIIIKQGLATEETVSGAGSHKRKKYTIIKVVDAKLESLAASILSSQKENFEMLARIDEIHGLLVDLIR